MFRNGIQIESLQESDCQAFIAMARKAHEETYPSVPRESWDRVFGAEDNASLRPADFGKVDHAYLVAKYAGQIIGYAKLKLHDKGYTYLDKLYVLRAFQKQGCGNWLLNACFGWALQRERSKMHMRVFKEDESALTFFEKQGFQQVGRPTEADIESGDFDFKMVCENIRAHYRAQPVSAATPSFWGRPEAKVGGGMLVSLSTWLLASRLTSSGPLQFLSVVLALSAYIYKVAFAGGGSGPAANNEAKNEDDAQEKLLPSSLRI